MIRDARRYRATHSTFEAYCSEWLGWSRRSGASDREADATRAALVRRIESA